MTNEKNKGDGRRSWISLVFSFIALCLSVPAVIVSCREAFPHQYPIPTATAEVRAIPAPNQTVQPESGVSSPTQEQIVVLVANFHNGEQFKENTRSHIVGALKEAFETHSVDNVQIKTIDRAYDWTHLQDLFDEGESHRANIVVWGYADASGIFPQITVISEYTGGIPPGSLTYIDRGLAPPNTTTGFFLNERTSEQLTYLSLFAIGQILYLQGDISQAISFFNNAIAQTPEHLQSLPNYKQTLARMYFYRGYIYHSSKNGPSEEYRNAWLDYETAISHEPEYESPYFNKGIMSYEYAIYNISQAQQPELSRAEHIEARNYAVSWLNDAISNFDRVVELNKSHVENAKYNRTVTLCELHRISALAEDRLRQMAGINATECSSYTMIGYIVNYHIQYDE